MNTSKKYRLFILFLATGIFLTSCRKEKVYVFGVDDVTVTQPGAEKPNIKTDEEFISIAYSDLFGTNISQSELGELSLSYVSFGDKRAVIDWIILNFLNDPAADVPTDAEMRADVNLFVNNTFRKFLVRDPNEFETWWISNQIENDTDMTPEVVYYTFMTSNEYRFY